MNKRGKAQMGALGWIAAIVVVVLLVQNMGGSQSTTSPGGGTDVTNTGICDDSVTLTPVARDAYAPGTAATASFLYKVNGGPVTQGEAGTAVTGLPCDAEIEYLFNATNYNDVHGTTTLSGETVRVEVEMLDPLDAAGDLLERVFNEDDGLLNSITNNESLAANDITDLEFSLIPAAKKGGKACIATVDYNVTAFDNIEIQGAPVVATPTWHTVDATANVMKSYLLGDLENSVKKEMILTIDVKNVDPVTERPKIDVNCADWFLNTDTGNFEFGYEDQDGNEVIDGTVDTQTVTLELD